jgi:hypothetical protein
MSNHAGIHVDIHVFVGPSLSHAEAREVLDATFLPPAQLGDVYRAVQGGAKVIAIIDGLFEQVPAVWHKEVLHALSRGVHVYGASSMGALRAAELHAFGMVGVGRIFRDYRDGRLEDDDEVTVVHGPAAQGFRPLSEAMVNIRYGLDQAVEAGAVTASVAGLLTSRFKQTHYAQRTWALLPELARELALPEAELKRLLSYMMQERPNLKRLDALELLKALADLDTSVMPAFRPAFDLEETGYWLQLVGTLQTPPVSSPVDAPLEAIKGHVAVTESEAAEIMRSSLLLYLVGREARRLGFVPDEKLVSSFAGRFRRSRGLLSAAATREWLAHNRVTEEDFSALMTLLTTVEEMLRLFSGGVNGFLPAELLRRGQLGEVCSSVRAKRELMARLGITFPDPDDAGVTVPELVGWYERCFRRMSAPLADHSRSVGISDHHQFVQELVAEYLRAGSAQAVRS